MRGKNSYIIRAKKAERTNIYFTKTISFDSS